MFHRENEVLRQGTGIAVEGATVTVYVNGTDTAGDYSAATKAPIYPANVVAAQIAGSVVTTDEFGHYAYYVPSGVYDEVLTYGSITKVDSYIQMFDMAGFTSDAETFAEAAEASAEAAAASATSALASKNDAAASATAAANSATDAAASSTTAGTARDAAVTAELASEASANASETSRSAAAVSETNAATSATAAAASAASIASLGPLHIVGSTDCSANPNYPAAGKGDAYLVSVAGKIGGAAGVSVDVGDLYVATAANAGGTQAAVGASWASLEHNAVFGAGSAITAKDEGSTLTASMTSVDFVGAGAVATNVGGAVTVTIPGGGAGWFNVKSYGALGDGVHLTDGVTNSTTTFTSASAAFVTGDVGKVIEITSGANRHITTIASRTNGTTVVLTAAASFTAAGCDVYYGTDDTVAIQAASDACASAGGGTVDFPRGIYIANGPLQDTSRSNAQLLLPRLNYGATKAITIVLRGEAPPSAGVSVIGATPVQDNLSVIKGTLNVGSGTAPCMIGAHGPVGTSFNYTNIFVVMRDLTVRMPANPVLTAVDFSCVSQVDLDNLMIDTGSYDVGSIAMQTTATSWGLKVPDLNNGALTRLGNVNVVGFYNGMSVCEHTVGQNVAVWACKQGYVFGAAYHSSAFTRMAYYHCQRGIVTVVGQHTTNIMELNSEQAASGTWVQTYDIDDGSNYLRGIVNWHSVLAGSGTADTFVVNGAKYVTRRHLLRADAVYGLTDGATVTIDCNIGCNFRWSIGGNRTFANPINPYDGQVINVRIIQDATGTRTWTLGSKFKFPGGAPALSTAANAHDFMSAQYDAADDTWNCALSKAMA